jgi:multiple sugar transport system permease protein
MTEIRDLAYRDAARGAGFRLPRRRWLVDWLNRHTELLFLLPTVLILGVLLVFPIGYTLYFSVHEWFAASQSPPKFVGLQNYVDMTRDPLFLRAVLRTVVYTGLAVGCELLIGVGMALAFSRPFLGRGIARTVFILPMVATPVAVGLVWLLMFDPVSGVFNYLLSLVGLPPSVWVGDPQTALLSLVLVDIWQWTPLVMLIALSGLATLPQEPFEAALIDGASVLQRFWHLTLPMLRPYIVVAALFRSVDALKSFDTIYVITRGGPAHSSETLNLYIYNQAFEYLHVGYSSALVVVFFCLVFAVSLVLINFRRRAQ